MKDSLILKIPDQRIKTNKVKLPKAIYSIIWKALYRQAMRFLNYKPEKQDSHKSTNSEWHYFQ